MKTLAPKKRAKRGEKAYRLAVSTTHTPDGPRITYILRCRVCYCNRAARYNGDRTADCLTCETRHLVEPVLAVTGSHAQTIGQATDEQREEAAHEYGTRRRIAERIGTDYPTFEEILFDIVSAPDGLDTLHTDSHTPETLRQGAYHQSFDWYGQGIRYAKGEDPVPQY